MPHQRVAANRYGKPLKNQFFTTNFMDFRKLENELQLLISEEKIAEAIEIVETELKKQPQSKFHNCIGRDMFHLSEKLNVFLNNFYVYAKNHIEGKPNGFIDSLFKKNIETGKTLKAISCEMNGITINYDLWFITLFGFHDCKENEDLDWLSDFDVYSQKNLVVTKFEDIQKSYKDYIENEKDEFEDQCDLCEILIFLRLQQLFQKTHQTAKSRNEEWTKLPIFVNGHDSELIYALK
jgi:hypothetical protein